MCQKWFQKHETTSLGFKKFEKNKILNFCHFWVPYATFEQQTCRKKRKMQKFPQKNEIEKSIFGRKQTNFGRYVVGRSGLSKILPKIFFIQNGQKFMILSQKNVPPQKKGPFFFLFFFTSWKKLWLNMFFLCLFVSIKYLFYLKLLSQSNMREKKIWSLRGRTAFFDTFWVWNRQTQKEQ